MALTSAEVTALAEAAPALIGVASALLTVIPHPAKYDSAFGFARRLLDFLALNFGHGAVSTVAQASLQGQPGAAALSPTGVQNLGVAK